jgi:hypothetical protein
VSAYNPYAAIANRGLGAFQAKLGVNCPTFLWNQGNPIAFDGTDQSWTCTPSTAAMKDPLLTGGAGSVFTLRFSVVIAQFFTNPLINTPDLLRQNMMNTPIGYLGGAYKIEMVEILPGGLSFNIEANAYHQNA